MEEKRCKYCGEIKPISDFTANKQAKDRFQPNCKVCQNEIVKQYLKTPRGLATSIYSAQKKRSIHNNFPLPNYTMDELRDWLFDQPNFYKLFCDWRDSGYKRDLIPSCDRLNDNKGYSFDNIQLISWKENREKHYSDVRAGINNKRNKAVRQYYMNGKFIKEYYSQSQATRETGILQCNISGACLGKVRDAGGFMWRLSIADI